MIHLVARRIEPAHRDRVVDWLRQVDGPRRAEALASIEAEGIDHETAILIETGEGPILVYAMQTDDIVGARTVADGSSRPIDAEHRAVMSAADAGPADGRLLLDLREGPIGHRCDEG